MQFQSIIVFQIIFHDFMENRKTSTENKSIMYITSGWLIFRSIMHFFFNL